MAQRNYNFDAAMQLKDAGLVAASAAAQVAGDDQIVDLGISGGGKVGRFEGVVVVDVSAIEIASNDEHYHVIVQVSSSPTFASDIENVAELDLGATEVRDGGALDSITGRYEIPFQTEQADVVRQYLRLYTLVSGTVATGINYTAFVAPIC